MLHIDCFAAYVFRIFSNFQRRCSQKSLKMAGRDRRVIEEDLANVEFETSEDVDVVPTFDSMKLREDLLRGVYAYGKKTGKILKEKRLEK